MSAEAELAALADLARPHVLACALAVTRLAPVAFLCPILGGALAPVPVRLGLCLALGACAHFAGGVDLAFAARTWPELGWALASEASIGLLLGLAAALPFEAARIGGRLWDVLRGANAEAMLPLTGSREAASGDLLHQLLCALVSASALMGLLTRALLLSFRAVPLGGGIAWGAGPLEGVLEAVTTAFAAGLAIGAPAAAVGLLVDAGTGLAARAAPALPLRELAAPFKLLLGGAAALFALSFAAQRLLAEVADSAERARALSLLLGGSP